MVKKFEEIANTTGFLVDAQIREALNCGYLIEKGTWEDSQIRHASYQLRLGDRVEVCRASQASSQNTKELAIVRLSSGHDTLELRPGDTALLYSIENLRLPDSILGFTVARGLLLLNRWFLRIPTSILGFREICIDDGNERVRTGSYISSTECRLQECFFQSSRAMLKPPTTQEQLWE